LRYHSLTNFEQPLDLEKLQEIWYQTELDVFGIDSSLKLYPFASFGHLMGGYDAGIFSFFLQFIFDLILEDIMDICSLK
jgi:hypothetical protein